MFIQNNIAANSIPLTIRIPYAIGFHFFTGVTLVPDNSADNLDEFCIEPVAAGQKI